MTLALLIAGSVVPIVLAPGASFALTVAGAAAGTPRAGLRVAGGVALALAFIAVVACLSPLGAMVADDERLRTALGLVGGGALLALGLRIAVGALPRKRKLTAAATTAETAARPEAVAPTPPAASAPPLVQRAFLTTIVNPKALAVYLAVVPAVATSAASPLPLVGAAFAATHATLTTGWLVLVGWSIGRAPALLRPRPRLALQLAAALGLAATGIALAVEAMR